MVGLETIGVVVVEVLLTFGGIVGPIVVPKIITSLIRTYLLTGEVVPGMFDCCLCSRMISS